MKITRLEINNLLRLKAVSIKADGRSVVLGGRNAQGKTSVLNAIEMALAGGRSIPDEPIRRGETSAEIVLETEDFVVRRTFSGGRTSSLEIRRADGGKVSSPQRLLDQVFGHLSFDPLSFDRMKPAERAAVLRKMIGVDTTPLEEKAAAAYAERTVVNRRVKQLEGTFASMPRPPKGLPAEAVDANEVIAEIRAVQKHNDARRELARKIEDHGANAERLEEELSRLEEQIKRVEKSLAATRADIDDARAEYDAGEDLDATALEGKLAGLQETNRQIAEREKREAVAHDLAAASEESAALTRQIDDLNDRAKRVLEDAKYPVAGLSVDGDGVKLDGIPYEQASQAQRLRASVAIGAATDTALRVMLVRDGAVLDDESLALLGEIAEEHNTQLWVEVVGDRKDATVIIEDGGVAEERSAA
jgi:DNA repair exonuclease SbcCD ATPase subunit